MTATASRLGSSPLTFDWSQLHGTINPAQEAPAFQKAWSHLKGRFEKKEVGFYDAPTSIEISQINETEALAQTILAQPHFTDCLFLGIGGSSLGPISLLYGLREKANTRLKFHFMENPDATEWGLTLKTLRPESTLICAVTKSGTTFETLAQLMLALEWTGKPRWKSHVVAITDPAKGDLRAFATQAGIPTLSIDPSLGGRFSIFSPVGLFPALLSGLSAKEFLKGATQVRDYIEKTAPEKNPLFLLGSELIRQYGKRPIHVCMPYSSALKPFSSWFVQLWGESLGKGGKGFTPVAALGATDQHSILQLLRDGPDDKVTFFLTVDRVTDEQKLPKGNQDLSRFSAFQILEGHSLHELLRIEYQATSLVMTRQNRPHLSIHLDAIDERNLGALYFSLCVMTAITGTLWEINPFDQPGVEEGKVYIRDALNQSKRETAEQIPWEDTPAGRLRRGST